MFILRNDQGDIVAHNSRIVYHKGQTLIGDTFYHYYTPDNTAIESVEVIDTAPDYKGIGFASVSGYSESDGLVVVNYECRIDDLATAKEVRRVQLRNQRDELVNHPINGIGVDKQSYREDIKEYAALLGAYADLPEEDKVAYSDIINDDGTIDWILADNTVRAVSADELNATHQQYFLRRGAAMTKYKAAVTALYNPDLTTYADIVGVVMED